MRKVFHNLKYLQKHYTWLVKQVNYACQKNGINFPGQNALIFSRGFIWLFLLDQFDWNKPDHSSLKVFKENFQIFLLLKMSHLEKW